MSRRRILLFCHDGTGLGHLQRISRLAGTLQEEFSTLVLCGMREASWIVPPDCGLVKLPDWDGIDYWRARRAGKTPWIDLSGHRATQFRAEAIRDVAALYKPDIIIVDYLPFGQRHELDALFSSRETLRYFLHRGLTDTSDGSILRGTATQRIADMYDRILVASDPRLVDIAAQDDYCANARAKLTYVGFIVPNLISRGRSWSPTVVCSGGGGYRAESLMLQCVKVAERNPHITLKIVLGPKSRLSASCFSVPSNCEVYGTRVDLPELHQTAAVVISSGGYNSVLEAITGGARMIIYPNQTGEDDEQRRFADRLSKYYPACQLDNLDALEEVLRATWLESIDQPVPALPLEMKGAERIRGLAESDLASHRSAPTT
jgi:predicted glycosyltransferase